MIDLSFIAGKRIGVVGLGLTGISAALVLHTSGATVVAWDDDPMKRENAANKDIPVADLSGMMSGFDFLLWSPGIPHYGDKAHPLALKAKAQNIPLACDVDIFMQAVSNDILAITGTNGKSTTTALVGHILAQFRHTRLGGNIGQPVLTLDPLPDDGVYVLELSSYQLELSPSLKPAGAVLLNITPDHLARHGTMEVYTAAKQKIFAHTPDDARKPMAVVSIDTDPARMIADELRAAGQWNVIPVSTKKKTSGVYVENGKLFDGDAQVGDMTLIPSIKGAHNYENAACAYALIRHVYGYEPSAIIQAMSSFEGLPHRQYLVRTINGITYINDSKATNAEAVSHALACMKNIYWIVGGQPKDGGLKGLEPYADRIAHAFLIGEAAEEFSKWFKASDIPYTISQTLDVAVLEAHQLAQSKRGAPGEAGTVLLSPACASWDQFQSFEHRGDVFTHLVQSLAEE